MWTDKVGDEWAKDVKVQQYYKVTQTKYEVRQVSETKSGLFWGVVMIWSLFSIYRGFYSKIAQDKNGSVADFGYMVVDYHLSCKELTALQSCKKIVSKKSWWTPDGVHILIMESIWILSGVHQDVWGSVIYSNIPCIYIPFIYFILFFSFSLHRSYFKVHSFTCLVDMNWTYFILLKLRMATYFNTLPFFQGHLCTMASS